MTCETFAWDFLVAFAFIQIAGGLAYFYFKKTYLALLVAQVLALILIIIFMPMVM